jgi:pyrroloquinoline quinone (PQQ) biosynthesis protein C
VGVLGERLDRFVALWDPLEHAFFTRLQAGKLPEPELADYSVQFAHLATARIIASQTATEFAPPGTAERTTLERLNEFERRRVLYWAGVAQFVGDDREHAALHATQLCVDAWTGAAQVALYGTWLSVVGASYATAVTCERIGPLLIAASSVLGLGIRQAETAYFRDADLTAATLRAILEAHADSESARHVEVSVVLSLRGYWRFLDGVHARTIQP